MKKTWTLLILGLLFALCTACQAETPLPPTETPLPPTETPLPPTPTPNPYAYYVFVDFCEAAVAGNLENALELVTEDFEIIFWGGEDEFYNTTHEGDRGVETLLNHYADIEVYDCTVRRFDLNGDEVNLWWTHYSPCFGYKCTASCECSATMQGDKIQKIVNDCVYEYWDKDEN